MKLRCLGCLVCLWCLGVACLGLEALNLWWQIQLDPESRALDPIFKTTANEAIAEAERMTSAEPNRAPRSGCWRWRRAAR